MLQSLKRTRERTELTEPTRWDSMRSWLFNLEPVGMLIAFVVLAVLALAVGIWLWALAGMMGWLMVIVVLLAALVYFHFSGIPHSAVKTPRRYSHNCYITMEDEQRVQYRLAGARDRCRRSREWSSRWKRRKD